MTAPILKKAGLTLKTVGNSNIYLSGTGIAVGHTVKVKRRGTGEIIWKGDVDKNAGKGSRAKLQFVQREDYFRNWKPARDPGDVIEVDVTVTNGGGEESGPVDEEVIIDGPE